MKLRKLVTGLAIPQEYVCLCAEDLSNEQRIFLTVKGKTGFLEVTQEVILLGYKPLVLAFTQSEGSLKEKGIEGQREIYLHFGRKNFEPDTLWEGADAFTGSLARMQLRLLSTLREGTHSVYFFEGIYGVHSFIHPFHQWVARQKERFRKRKEGNISLEGNLYDQVRIAYSVPRIISVITVCDNDLVNMFPTDLHGSLGAMAYAGSLRHGGKANEQVEKSGRVVISDVRPAWYRESYALGKNHMRPMQRKEEFPIHDQLSAAFQFPLPAGVVRYRELIWKKAFDIGIHRIHIYEVVSSYTMEDSSTLAHVHCTYLQWRAGQGLRTSYFLR